MILVGYDIYLRDPVSRETLNLPYAHVMTGSMFKAEIDPETGRFVPKPDTEAHLSITYNYSKYYYEASEGDDRFLKDGDNAGIRGIYEKFGLESIPMLEDMISRIREKYPELECDDDYWKSCPGNAVKPLYMLLTFAKMRPDGVWEGD